MPEYTLMSLAVLGAALAVAAGRGLLGRRSTWLALGIFGATTVVADMVLTGLPIVTYGDAHVRGLMLGPMPIEDLLYGLALFLVASVAWDAARPRRAPAGGGDGP
jgi:lycopene cyclase domain-containing protein